VGLLCPPGDADAMAAVLLRLASVPGEAARIGALGRREVDEHYTVSSVADRYIALYRSLLAPSTETAGRR
jgi:glycosyltransferase involved in cell wall biosynthesis